MKRKQRNNPGPGRNGSRRGFRGILLVTGVLIVGLCTGLPAFAQQAVKPGALPVLQDPQQEIPGKVAQVTLTKKTRKDVWAGEKRFAVTGQTRIIAQSGLYLSLAELAVPCEALIQFEQDVNSQALKITVQKIYPNANRRFVEQRPE